MDAARHTLRKNEFLDVAKLGVVFRSDLFAALVKALSFAQLMKPNGRGDVGEVVFETWSDDFVIPGTFGGITFPGVARNAVQRHDAHPIGIFIIVSASHAAL